MTTIAIQRLAHAADLPLPAYATAGAAGFDLPAAEALTLPAGEHRLVKTGFAMAIPPGFEAQVRPRSGLAAKHGVTVLNAPGTIDSDYRGEIGVILVNHGRQPFLVERGMRIAQVVVAAVVQAKLIEAESLNSTARGTGGFGSTGLQG